jgi:hypothetical protein
MPSNAEARRKLAASRDALGRDDLKRAGQDAWAAAAIAASIEDEEMLHALMDVASALERKASGREREEAERLRLYLTQCLTDARNGTRQASMVERLINSRKPSR